jgi:hypothetical protein
MKGHVLVISTLYLAYDFSNRLEKHFDINEQLSSILQG